MGVIGSETIHGGNTGSGQSMGLPDSDVGVDVESCSGIGGNEFCLDGVKLFLACMACVASLLQ